MNTKKVSDIHWRERQRAMIQGKEGRESEADEVERSTVLLRLSFSLSNTGLLLPLMLLVLASLLVLSLALYFACRCGFFSWYQEGLKQIL